MALAALAAAAFGAGAFAFTASAGASRPRSPRHDSGKAFAVVLPAPSAGDVTYGVAQVRIGGKLRSIAPAGATVFSQRVGGLAIVARSASWRSLRKTTRVYVVITRVPGANNRLRAVAFFIVRRRVDGRRADSARGKLTFTIPNARADTNSFWVRGVNRSGYAEIFAVRNILATAIGNWSRYVAALKVAPALAAAVPQPPRSQATSLHNALKPSIWKGGQRPDALVREMYGLIFGSIGNAAAYAAVKKNAFVAEFIQDELHNPSLARRWQAVTARVPLQVPDKYAAAAKEEKLFMRRRPRARTAQVSGPVCAGGNASYAAECYAPSERTVVTVVKAGSGSGTVRAAETGGLNPVAPMDCGAVCSVNVLATEFLGIGELVAVPDSGSRFAGWGTTSGDRCFPLSGVPDGCFLVFGTATTTVTATFTRVSGSGGTPPPLGSITEFDVPTPGAGPIGIASGPDGNVWFTEEHGDKIGKVTVGGSITEYRLPPDLSEPTSIAVDGDGNLWFVGEYNAAIGEITTGGQISVYPLPGSPQGSDAPNSITLGPAGNLWFTNNEANTIGRIDPSQAVPGTSDGISEFSIPTSGSSPESITTGPDGNVWFVETYANKIGRIVPSEASSGTSQGITEYPIPMPGDGPAQITTGPDGNLWFTDVYSGEVGQIVPGDVVAGASDGITYFEPPTSDSGPVGIAAGPGGDLWFAESGANKIGHLALTEVSAGTSDGITELPVPTANAEPQSIVTGPDGNVWFTEFGADKIGRVYTGAG